VEDVGRAAAALIMGTGVGPVDIGRPRLPYGNEHERNQDKSNSGHRVGSEVCTNCQHGSIFLCNQVEMERKVNAFITLSILSAIQTTAT
jgi:hypothetical protein